MLPVQTSNTQCGAFGLGCVACGPGATCRSGVCDSRLALSLSVSGPVARLAATPLGGTAVSCIGACSLPFDAGTQLTVDITGFQGHSIASVTGACTSPTCALTLNSNATVTATAIRHNLAFVTSASFTGDLGGVVGADFKCNLAAFDAGLVGSYVSSASAPTNLFTARLIMASGGWVSMEGLPIAVDRDQLTALRTFHPINVTELGTTRVTPVWVGAATGTGSLADSTKHCASWTLGGDAGTGGIFGGSQRLGLRTFDQTTLGTVSRGCDLTSALYCFGVDSLAAIPAPTFAAGDRRAFATRTKLPGFVPNAIADTVCMNEAADAGLTGTFRVLRSTDTTPASAAFSPDGGPWRRVDGALLVRRASDLFGPASTRFLTSVALTANGGAVDSVNPGVWSGSTEPFLVSANQSCASWTSDAGNAMGGNMLDVDFAFGGPNFSQCGSTSNVLCFQQ